jgi:hypothetical protein
MILSSVVLSKTLPFENHNVVGLACLFNIINVTEAKFYK